MSIVDAYRICIQKYVMFDGRARRREYWGFVLCDFLIKFTLYISTLVFSPLLVLMVLYSLFSFLPGIAVTFRRLHDIGKSGAWYFIFLVPVVGEIILLVFLCEQSYEGPNQYGANPKDNLGYFERRPLVGQLERKDNYSPRIAAGSLSRMKVNCIAGPYAGLTAIGEVIYIGRDSNLCQIVFPPDAQGVSRVHCMLHIDGKIIELIDMNSTYGTYLVNGNRISANTRVYLNNGDTFSVGDKHNLIMVSVL